jgi:hypothetical protein
MWDYLEQTRLDFVKWLQSLSNGEAAFYVSFLEYGLEILGIVFVAIVAWLLTKFRNKNKPNEPEISAEKTETPPGNNPTTNHAEQGVAGITAQQVTINQNFSDTTQTTPKKPTDQKPPKNTPITIDRLPTVPGAFYGRSQELALLTQAIQPNAKTRIVQLIAAGGTGKTKLLRHWLNENAPAVPNRIIWSFYSQGTTEAKQVSLSPLLAEAFKAFGIDPDGFQNDEDRADKLFELLVQHRCLLVLDGLEPMQHWEGMLKDKALLRLLRKLLDQDSVRCIITSRIKVYELYQQYGDKVITKDLHNLSLDDAVKLLQSLKVTGRLDQLQAAATEYACHALAIHLLGKVLAMRYGGDVQKRDLIKALPIGPQGGHINRHAFRVMHEYQDWFADKPELTVLYLLGLFDQPIETEILEQLQQAQIPALTQNLSKEDLHQAIYHLRENNQILSQHPERKDLVDCHPLIREYFGQQLKQNQPEAYKAAHQTLYAYYKAIPKQKQPDTLEAMRPLFAAVAHGCAAGMHQQVLDEVYWPRIQRSGENYLRSKLGAFSDDLAVVAHFFDTPWHTPAAGLEPYWQAAVLNWAGFGLRALGRLREALEPMRAGMEMRVAQEDWKGAAINAGNLSELQLTLGEVADAVQTGALSVDYAERSKDKFMRMANRTTQADALHQAGRAGQALALFQEAEHIQQQHQPEYPHLYSVQGFQYCDLLLAQAGADDRRIRQVLGRCEEWVSWRQEGDSLLDRSLEYLTLARAHLQGQNHRQAAEWLDQAVAGLRAANRDDYLPRSLLTRAALYRETAQYSLAQHDLQEVFDIAQPSGMRLHLTDYHLESARLGLAAGWPQDQIQTHLQAAAELIEKTGYHRRDAEWAGLQNQINHG